MTHGHQQTDFSPAGINLTWLVRLQKWVSRAFRLICFSSIAIFLPSYVFLLYPAVYESQPMWLIMQPIALAAAVISWRAIGHSIRCLQAISLACLWFSAANSIFLVIGAVQSRQLLLEYSASFPDPQWHEMLVRFGPETPFFFFVAVFGTLALVMSIGSLAALFLRFYRIRGTGLSLVGLDKKVRRKIAESGDAPNLIRLIDGWKWWGWLAGLGAIVVSLVPLMFSGRETLLPPTTGLAGKLPDVIVRALTFLNDRFVVIAICLVVATILWRQARWLLNPTAQIVLANTNQPPILLLRSFKDDHAAVRPKDVWLRALHFPLWPIRAVLNGFQAKGAAVALHGITRRRLEEVAAGALNNAGPFVAIGEREGKQPELGAFRATFATKIWKEYVEKWFGSASMVVMVAGLTPSVRWELQTAARRGVLDKVLLLLPPNGVAQRWLVVTECLADTPWSHQLQATDPSRLLAVRFAPGGRVIAITSARRDERDYDLAIRIGQGLIFA